MPFVQCGLSQSKKKKNNNLLNQCLYKQQAKWLWQLRELETLLIFIWSTGEYDPQEIHLIKSDRGKPKMNCLMGAQRIGEIAKNKIYYELQRARRHYRWIDTLHERRERKKWIIAFSINVSLDGNNESWAEQVQHFDANLMIM